LALPSPLFLRFLGASIDSLRPHHTAICDTGHIRKKNSQVSNLPCTAAIRGAPFVPRTIGFWRLEAGRIRPLPGQRTG
jgi:hypothetical protein